MMQHSLFAFCDNWWVEKNYAYFCVRRMGAVLAIDLNEKRCELITRFPQCKVPAHLTNSFCIKQEDFIFCIPYSEKDIGYYDLKKNVWGTIETGCEKKMLICADTYDECDGRIWLAEHYGKRIYQINLKDKILEKQYCISSDSECINGEYVCAGACLYCIVGKCVYCIDRNNSEIMRYQILNTEDQLYTICYDGCNFWLSGNRKEIYIWNPNKGIIKVIDGLETFGNFRLAGNIIRKDIPVFLHSVVMGTCIWYIPLQANMPIIYIDSKNFEINILEIEEEKETEESLADRGSGFKYIFLYSKQYRYIGLFSLKNQVVWEIDTIGLCVEKKEFYFSKQAIDALLRGYYDENIVLLEGRQCDESAYSIMLKYDLGQNVMTKDKAGYKIYHSI